MPRVLRMPSVSANATEAVLAEWLVAESAEFAVADSLATVETDKALVDVEADAAGVLLTTLVTAGTSVEVGAPIAVLGTVGEQVDDLAALLSELGVEGDPAPVERGRRTEPDVDPGSGRRRSSSRPPKSLRGRPGGLTSAPECGPRPSDPAASHPTHPRGRVFASPLARRIARDAGIGIDDIPGTGPRNRVLRRDVEAALAARRATPAARSRPRTGRPVSRRDRPPNQPPPTTRSRTPGCGWQWRSGWPRASARLRTSTSAPRSASSGCWRCAPSSTTPSTAR